MDVQYLYVFIQLLLPLERKAAVIYVSSAIGRTSLYC